VTGSVLVLGGSAALEAAVREAGAVVVADEGRLADAPPDGWTAVFAPADDDRDLAALEALRKLDPAVPIVGVATKGDVARASAAIAAGAQDFLVLGADLPRRVKTTLRKLEPLHHLRSENARLREQVGDWSLVGRSPAMEALRTRIGRVARVPRPVLIRGERGTGKELVARAIHEAAGAPGRPLVAVNCASFGEGLLESELFGHERGAFTGADRRVSGRFEQARDGTLFRDEIGSTSIQFQQKVLRAVEYGEFRRVGGEEDLHSNARIIAATNADLETAIARGTFLADLYDRLACEALDVPPLRERGDDVERLARLFLDRFAREVPGLAGKRLGADALRALREAAFPGNVRELKHVVERAAYRSAGDEIGAADLGLAAGPPVESSFDAAVARFQRVLLVDALERAGGNQAQAARSLGMSYHSFRYYAKRLLGDG
jgi:DNA-binding NtrC family response regulator